MYRLIDYGPMVSDSRRIDAYRRALACVITPSSVLLDLGAGLGTFSVLACKLGAARVYAIESGDVITVAEEIARANGVADRIRFLHAHSAAVELPERVDAIVSDLAGALPLFGDHLTSIIDARERFLKPGGVLIPRRSRLWCGAVSNADLYERILAPWRSVPDVDLGPAKAMALQTALPTKVAPEDLAGEPQVWAELDYATLTSPNVRGEVEWKISKPIHAIALWFDSTLHGDVSVASGPWSEGSVHATMVLPLLQPLDGNVLHLTIEATLAADRYVVTWHARTDENAGARQSTFLSEPHSTASLRDRTGIDAASASVHVAFRISDRVLARTVGTELLLLDTATGVYHVLNETGAEIWTMLLRGEPVDAIANAIASQFAIDDERAAADVAALVAEMRAAGLIEALP